MSLSRVHIGREIDLRLRTLKTRTGLTPNLLCRLGFCLSMDEPGVPDPRLYEDDQAREFNRYTLTGQWDIFFFALLRQRLAQDNLDIEAELESQFRAHLCRGVMLLSQRLKTLADLANLIAGAQAKSAVMHQTDN